MEYILGNKKRIDVLLVERGLETSRERAKALVMSGNVFSCGQRIEKAGEEIDTEAEIEVKTGLKYVSRGGLKLEKAMATFGLELAGKVCMDIGASTGGFTDCMLQNGAAKVYSVDVGYGQLAWKLRTDSRVINFERTNIRHLTADKISDEIAFFSIDVSFISLTLVLPAIKSFLAQDAHGVCLIKPQFEAGKGKVGKKGVVREPEIHRDVIKKIYDFASNHDLFVAGLDFSPVKGPEGNIEYLIYLKNHCQNDDIPIKIDEIDNIVESSHKQLSGGV
jgi:23S rRNA (cytidine1920-2'-O)/16S rRNA (cytidine1409-2'-O)-methyltransferase